MELSGPTGLPSRNAPTVRLAWWRRTSTAIKRSCERTLRVFVISDRPAVDAAPARLRREAVDPRAQLDLARQGGGPAFVGKRVERDLPALSALAQEVLAGHDDVLEEQLAELRVTGDLRHRSHLHARRLHIDDQEGDPPMPRLRWLGAREHAAPPRVLAPGGPRLLAADHELVARGHSARTQRPQVRSGIRLREALAPDLLRGEDRRDIACPLGVVAERQQRGTDHVETDDVGELGRAGGRQFLVDDDLLHGRAAADLRTAPAMPGRRNRPHGTGAATRAGSASDHRARRARPLGQDSARAGTP